MSTRSFRISVLALCLAAYAAVAALAAGLPTPDNDPLSGKWLIIEGEVKEQGFVFDATITGSCGRADFRQYVGKVKFEPNSPPGARTVPWGEFAYRFDQKDVLALSPATGPEIRCFLKYKDDSMRSVGPGTEVPMPYVFVFYEPEGRRAFKMISVHAGRLACPLVYVPYEDILTGSWEVLASHPAANGQLDVPLSTSATAVAAHLAVHANNSAELTSGSTTRAFQLRQFDPTHWAIVAPPNVPGTTGTITLEQTTRRLLGPAFLPIRWQVGQKNMAAVLRSQGTQARSSVPALQFPNAEPLNFDALKLPATTPPAVATAPLPIATQPGAAKD